MTSYQAFRRRYGDRNLCQHPRDLGDLRDIRKCRIYTGDIMRTVMLSSRPYTLLRVECTLQLGKIGVRIDGAKEDGFVLREGL